jgi:hypothetical protein
MSKGTRIVTLRVPDELRRACEAQIDMSEPWRAGEPWTLGEFIRVAIKEKLAKMARCRRRYRRKARKEGV